LQWNEKKLGQNVFVALLLYVPKKDNPVFEYKITTGNIVPWKMKKVGLCYCMKRKSENCVNDFFVEEIE
jgi:hypothetical protein